MDSDVIAHSETVWLLGDIDGGIQIKQEPESSPFFDSLLQDTLMSESGSLATHSDVQVTQIKKEPFLKRELLDVDADVHDVQNTADLEENLFQGDKDGDASCEQEIKCEIEEEAYNFPDSCFEYCVGATNGENEQEVHPSITSAVVPTKGSDTREKLYKCELCSESFTRCQAFNVHMTSHYGERPFKCEHCNKCFAKFGNLGLHIRNHTEEKRFKCKVCGKCFFHLNALNNHARIHTAVKPYQCEECKKCFSKAGYYFGHLRTHTGEKPFKCDICNMCFSHSRHRTSHMKTHTEVLQ